jgi:small-conductance mechanosensitive channel
VHQEEMARRVKTESAFQEEQDQKENLELQLDTQEQRVTVDQLDQLAHQDDQETMAQLEQAEKMEHQEPQVVTDPPVVTEHQAPKERPDQLV